MRRIVFLLSLISILASLVFILGAGPVFADGEQGALEVAFSSIPRFPVVGEEAVLTFKISHNGSLEQGQTVMVMLAKTEAGDHGHEEGEAEAEADHADMAGMDHGAQAEEPAPMIHLMPVETSPGVYMAKHTFEQGGRYVATVSVLGDEADVIVAVRSSPIAWPFIFGLAGVSTLLAGVVAVIKTIRKEW